MSARKFTEYAVGIPVPLAMFWAEEPGWFRVPEVQSEAGDPDDRSTEGSRSIREAEERGRCPRFAPPFRIWDSTHPVGMVKNPACVPSGRRFASLIFGFESGSRGGSLRSVQQEQERRIGGSPTNRRKKGVRAE